MSAAASIADRPFLIIGGQPKAGTTSVFRWLADHPGTVPSKVNEARFFLDPGYPLPSGTRFDGHNLEDYARCFPAWEEGRVHVESSPDYLYCRSPLRIAELLPKARIVFLIRDPLDRAVSWYRFAAQLGHLPKGMTFEEYIRAQIGVEVTPETPVHLRTLDQNRAEHYLAPFREAFCERCLSVDFADLTRDPNGLMQRIARFGGLDPAFYQGRDLTAQNVTQGVHAARSARIYYRTRAWLVYNLGLTREMKQYFRPLSRAIKPLLSGRDAVPPVVVTEEIRKLLLDLSATPAVAGDGPI